MKLSEERKDLIEYIKLQTELSQLQEKGWKEQYADLERAYKNLRHDMIERDYEEFKAPDLNNDDTITKEEVIFKYLCFFSFVFSLSLMSRNTCPHFLN